MEFCPKKIYRNYIYLDPDTIIENFKQLQAPKKSFQSESSNTGITMSTNASIARDERMFDIAKLKPLTDFILMSLVGGLFEG